jgi:hypothetical protein
MGESKGQDRKKVVIHTRVSEPLEQALKEKASDLGLSVSTLVRNLLNNTVDMVEEVVVDSARVAGSARGVAPEARIDWRREAAASEPQVARKRLGWQRLRLSMNALCYKCNAILPRGGKAHASVDSPPGPQQLACSDCVEAMCSVPGQEEAAP